MSKSYLQIDEKLAQWIRAQHVFFVATAPLSKDGYVNCSPKGGDSFIIIDPLTVAYLDYTGSGVETIAHLKENERIVIMFSGFNGPPKIVRLHGKGEVITPKYKEFAQLLKCFVSNPGVRAIIRVKLTRVSDSCGMSVPYYDYKGNRDALDQWALSKGPEKLDEYRKQKNLKSINGLAGL